MSQRTRVVGARGPLVWLLVVVAIVVVAGIIVGVLVFLPQRDAGQHYQAGLAFEAVEEWEAARQEYIQVIAIDAGYRDTQARLAQVRARLSESAATATAAVVAVAEQAQATAHAEATDQAAALAETQADAAATAAAAPTATAQALEQHYTRAVALVNLEQWVEAQVELRAIFDVDPNYKDIQAQLAMVNAEAARLTPTPEPQVALTPTDTPAAIISPTPSAYFVESFDGTLLDTSKWETVGGIVKMGNGKVQLESSSRTFPYIYTMYDPFPAQGDFLFAIKLRYPSVTGRGVGCVLTTIRPPSGASEGQRLEGMILQIWQDAGSGWQVLYGHERILVHSLPAPDSAQHVVELRHIDGKYFVYVDGALVYTSAATSERPSVLWFGNPVDTGANAQWTSLEVDEINIAAITP